MTPTSCSPTLFGANTSRTAKAKIVVAWRDNGGYDVDQEVPPGRAEIHMEDVGMYTG